MLGAAIISMAKCNIPGFEQVILENKSSTWLLCCKHTYNSLTKPLEYYKLYITWQEMNEKEKKKEIERKEGREDRSLVEEVLSLLFLLHLLPPHPLLYHHRPPSSSQSHLVTQWQKQSIIPARLDGSYLHAIAWIMTALNYLLSNQCINVHCKTLSAKIQSIVVQFYPWFKFYFSLSLSYITIPKNKGK